MNASSEDCFICIMKRLERDLLAAQEFDSWAIAIEIFQRLKSAFGKYPYSRSYLLAESLCSVHRQNDVVVPEVVWTAVELLMGLFEELNLPEGTPAAELLRPAYYFTENLRSMLRGCALAPRSLFSGHPMLTDIEFQQILKEAYRVQQSPEISDNCIACDDKQHIVWYAIKDGREKMLSVLLRYGTMFVATEHCNGIDLYELNSALRCLDGHSASTISVISHDDFFDRAEKLGWSIHRVPFVLRVMLLLTFEFCKKRNQEPSENRRPRLDGSGEDSTSGSASFRCLRRAFETIPEPIVSSDELRILFRVTCDNMDERAETRIDEAIAEFEKLYPEGADTFAPRSLQHLSRCEVRQNLRQAGALPHGIRHLGLPKSIGKYIALDE